MEMHRWRNANEGMITSPSTTVWFWGFSRKCGPCLSSEGDAGSDIFTFLLGPSLS